MSVGLLSLLLIFEQIQQAAVVSLMLFLNILKTLNRKEKAFRIAQSKSVVISKATILN